MSMNRKIMQTCDLAVTPLTTAERKRLNKKIQGRYEQLRNKYRQIHGKVVDWVSHTFEEGSLYIDIRFKDKTEFSLRFSPQIVTDEIDLSDVSTGDIKIIREYYRRREPS
jgi:hypothetical protein